MNEWVSPYVCYNSYYIFSGVRPMLREVYRYFSAIENKCKNSLKIVEWWAKALLDIIIEQSGELVLNQAFTNQFIETMEILATKAAGSQINYFLWYCLIIYKTNFWNKKNKEEILSSLMQ